MPSEHAISIGNQTSFSAPSPTYPFDYAVGHGFDAFEFFPDRRDDGQGFCSEDFDAAERRDLANLALAHRIRVSVHAPWWANPLKPAGLEELSNTLALARDLGARLINIHLFAETGIATFAEAIAPFAEAVHAAGCQLAIENTVETPAAHFNELFGLLPSYLGPAARSCGMCLDIGHANLEQSTRNDYLAFVDSLLPEVPIIHGHLHENWGDCDSHLTLFSGPAARDSRGVEGLCQRLEARAFRGSLILEQWPNPAELLDRARNRLRCLFGYID